MVITDKIHLLQDQVGRPLENQEPSLANNPDVMGADTPSALPRSNDLQANPNILTSAEPANPEPSKKVESAKATSAQLADLPLSHAVFNAKGMAKLVEPTTAIFHQVPVATPTSLTAEHDFPLKARVMQTRKRKTELEALGVSKKLKESQGDMSGKRYTRSAAGTSRQRNVVEIRQIAAEANPERERLTSTYHFYDKPQAFACTVFYFLPSVFMI